MTVVIEPADEVQQWNAVLAIWTFDLGGVRSIGTPLPPAKIQAGRLDQQVQASRHQSRGRRQTRRCLSLGRLAWFSLLYTIAKVA